MGSVVFSAAPLWRTPTTVTINCYLQLCDGDAVRVIKRKRLNVSRSIDSTSKMCACVCSLVVEIHSFHIQFHFESYEMAHTTSLKQCTNQMDKSLFFILYARASIPISRCFPGRREGGVSFAFDEHTVEKSNRRIYGSKFISGEIEKMRVCVCMWSTHFKRMQNDLTEQFAFNRLLLLNVACECRNANVVFSCSCSLLKQFPPFHEETKTQAQEIQGVCDKYQFIVLAELC